MATSFIPTKCSICNEETNTYPCRGCSQEFCFDHLAQHRQSLKEQLSLIHDDFNQFRQNIIDVKNNSEEHPLIKQIDEWEYESIQRIRQKANECRQLLIEYPNQSTGDIERKLNEMNQQFDSNQKQNKDLNEIGLNILRKKLEELKKQLIQPKNVSIKRKRNSFIGEISIRSIFQSKFDLFLIEKSDEIRSGDFLSSNLLVDYPIIFERKYFSSIDCSACDLFNSISIKRNLFLQNIFPRQSKSFVVFSHTSSLLFFILITENKILKKNVFSFRSNSY